MAKSKTPRKTPEASAAPVTPSTMPASVTYRQSIVHIPTIRERIEKASHDVTLALAGLLIKHSDGAVRGPLAYEPNGRVMLESALVALARVEEELAWVLAHPEAHVIDIACPTDEDWQYFQSEADWRQANNIQ